MAQEIYNTLVYSDKSGSHRQSSLHMRVGKAAVGRILTMLMRLVIAKMLTIEEEHATMNAVYT